MYYYSISTKISVSLSSMLQSVFKNKHYKKIVLVVVIDVLV